MSVSLRQGPGRSGRERGKSSTGNGGLRGKAVGGSVEGFQCGLVRVGRRRTEVSDGREGIRRHCFSIHRYSLLPDAAAAAGVKGRGGRAGGGGQEEEQGNKRDKRRSKGTRGTRGGAREQVGQEEEQGKRDKRRSKGTRRTRGGAMEQEGQEEEQGNKRGKRKEGREGYGMQRSGSAGSGVNRLRIKVEPGLIYCHHRAFGGAHVGAGQRKRGRHSTRTIVCGRYGRVASSYSRGRQKLTPPAQNNNALHVNCCWKPGRESVHRSTIPLASQSADQLFHWPVNPPIDQ